MLASKTRKYAFVFLRQTDLLNIVADFLNKKQEAAVGMLLPLHALNIFRPFTLLVLALGNFVFIIRGSR